MDRERSCYFGTRRDEAVSPGTPEARKMDIHLRAYEIWIEEGKPVGRDSIHWSRAEREFEEMVGGW